MSDAAEVIRKKYLYRRLILSRRLPVSAKGAALLIGPDCAYHLYFRHAGESKRLSATSSARAARRCPPA